MANCFGRFFWRINFLRPIAPLFVPPLLSRHNSVYIMQIRKKGVGKFVKQLADYTTKCLIDRGVISEKNASIYSYGFEVLFLTMVMFGSILFLASLIGNFWETIAFLLAFISLRMYAGGFHASTRVRCICLSLLMYGIFSVVFMIIPKTLYMVFSFLIAGIAFVCIVFWAPVQHKNHQVFTREEKRLKKISLFICGIDTTIFLLSQSVFTYNSLFFAFALGLFSAVILMPIAKIAN